MSAWLSATGRIGMQPEARIIAAMAEHGDNYLSFKHIAERTRLSRDEIAPIVRDLAARGLAKFGRGLWTEDGEMYGSGYALTAEGLKLADAAEEAALRAHLQSRQP